MVPVNRDDEFAFKERFIRTVALNMYNYNAVAQIDPPKGVELVKRDVTLDPGWTIKGTVLGPDGPAPGRGVGNRPRQTGRSWGPSRGAESGRVCDDQPVQPADTAGPYLLQHPTKKLIGVARPPKDSQWRLDHRADAARRDGYRPAGRSGWATASWCRIGPLVPPKGLGQTRLCGLVRFFRPCMHENR